MATGLVLGLAGVGVVGCSSAPSIDYYTLDMRSSGRVEIPATVRVERLGLTDALSRPGLMVATSPTRVEYYATQRWVGGLDELVARKLQAELGGDRDGSPRYLLTGTVQAFEQVEAAGKTEARVQLEVEVRDSGDDPTAPPVLTGVYRAVRPVAGASPMAVVEELSRAVEEVAVAIAEDLATELEARGRQSKRSRSPGSSTQG